MRLIKTVPITLITGYLGSGKTTLINHILKNAKGHKMAVIVNDIGEVNIDADLIQAGGVVASKDDNLVALSNGCICCTLKKDLINQLAELVKSKKFDHILIEASGICEPVPIAQTITYMQNEFKRQNLPEFYKLDAIISVTDALRLKDEFGCGETLEEAKRGEEDLENLVIQQIEFCDIVLLNKASELTDEELRRVKMTIRAIQDSAQIIETDYCNIDIDKLIDTNLFDFEKASTSAAWIREFEDWNTDVEVHDDDDEDEEHEHHHHHHHHHGVENEDEGTALEYDINTFVYYRRKGFDENKFKDWVSSCDKHKIIRAKGILYFTGDPDYVYLYESAGRQKSLGINGKWYSAQMTKEQLEDLVKNDVSFAHDRDETYQDKLIKLVFIGQNLDEKAIRKELDQI
ncbi:MAG: GTP-binding protein [Bacilli bacterium]|nr:GTP-binding protein [Bacilli bacterium]